MTPRLHHLRASLLIPALALGLWLPACGGAADPAKLTESGYAALGASDYKGALGDFRDALAVMQSSDPGYKRTKMGEIEALVHRDADAARDEFCKLAAAMPAQVDAKDFVAVASKLTGEQKFMEAIGVLEVGLKAHSDDVKLRQIGEKIKEAAAKAGDAKALSALEGLGYTG